MYLTAACGTLVPSTMSPQTVELNQPFKPRIRSGCCARCSAKIAEAGERERRRLERNLHDGAQQRLVSLALQLKLIGARLAPGSEAEALLAAASDELAASLRELRELAHGLHPAVLDVHGLGAALHSLALRAQLPVDVRVELEGRLPAAVEVAAYYVASEALANVAKHARADSARVSAVVVGDHLLVEVADDGIGGADVDGGSGLRGLAERVEAVGGSLRVCSAPGDGTSVRADFPCARS
jgi:signal transduction histidine kinase